MLDFMKAAAKETRSGVEIYPKFIVKSSEDLMIRGSEFYAIWNESTNLWSTEEEVALYLIDEELKAGAEQYKKDHQDCGKIRIAHMWDGDTKMVNKFHLYIKEQLWDNSHTLDEKIIFSNTETKKTDYVSKKLPYALENVPTPAWDEIISTLYSPQERHKIEWIIGCVVANKSKDLQKFMVMYGAPGTGKSTIINIIEKLFEGYCAPFSASALGNPNNTFALEPFKKNPLVAIQHDGDLSRIEDNTRLNSIVSHESMVMNEKHKSMYEMRFNSLLIMGTNKPVKITDSRSGIMRRLIDVSPTGVTFPRETYDKLMKKVKFELGGIASHCLAVYEENTGYYNSYKPIAMIGASNDFYNFVLESYDVFKRDDSVSLSTAYKMYEEYCNSANVRYKYSRTAFKEELKSYFESFSERSSTPDGDGIRVWNLYSGFIADKFMNVLDANDSRKKPKEEKAKKKLELNCTKSILDDICKDWPAQYATEDEREKPILAWDSVSTTLKDLDTSKTHYLFYPAEYKNHIVIDFDLKDAEGNKSFDLNAEAAATWPATYAEVSKGGQGIHLHYIYNGDVSKLSSIYDDNIEVKIFTGKSSLRRRVSRCNDIPIATISSGLPLKENKKVIDFEGFKNEKALRTYIKRNLHKEYVGYTKPSIDFIFNALEKAYADGVEYDVSDLSSAIISFAGRSSNNANYCLERTAKMKWKSEKLSENFEQYDNDILVFFDVEVFPNLFVIVYKAEGKNCIKLINPTPRDVEELLKFKLVGFNNRKYDNHILYARLLGESNAELFRRSAALTSNDKNISNKPYIAKAYNISHTDIWDFAVNKQGLKKWEIELKIPHLELGLPWDEPVDESLWNKVADYCVNDVLATEAVFYHLREDYTARIILADIANGTANDTTNSLSSKFMFGNNKTPQSHFRYRNLAEPIYDIPDDMREFLTKNFPEMMAEPHGEAKSILPYFPNYVFDRLKPGKQKSTYRGYDVGEGGFVDAKPGMYANVWSLDSASHHPSSIATEYLFGDYTPRFYDILLARVAIKHKDFEAAGKMFDGKLKPYLTPDSDTKGLSTALKRVINSVYGLTAQVEKGDYISTFRDRRNIDNIVAKRGALFMVDLLEAIQERGGTVIHCKTDSQKVLNPTPELVDFITKFAKRYGYTFEIEHKFEKICLVNDAVYIAKLAEDDDEWIGACKKAEAKGQPMPTRWTATGAQFQVPYVFKTLFSKEPIIFDDYCETKSVTRPATMYLDFNEGLEEGQHNYQFIGNVGQFTPVKDGVGGGILVRSKIAENGSVKYDSVTGTKGYRWLESETIRDRHLEHPEDLVDKSYYISKVDEAVADLSKFGDVEWFCS